MSGNGRRGIYGKSDRIEINALFVYNIYGEKLLYNGTFASIMKTIANKDELTMTSENVA